MRTIKFKGKRLDNGEWVVGDLAHSLDGALNILGFDTKDGVTNFSGAHLIDPQTVCQFTGFTDKNGREIYEGDVLRSDKYPFSFLDEGHNERDNYYGIVCWSEIEASFYMAALKNPDSKVSGVNDGICNPITQKSLRHFEVVGTVHSPEWQRKLDLKDE